MALAGVFFQLVMALQRSLLQVIVGPITSVTQVALPVALVGVVTVVRQTVPPTTQISCSYQPMALPSDGSMTFLQSSACKMDMACYKKGESPPQSELDADKRFSDLQNQLSKFVGNSEKMKAMEKMPKAVETVMEISKTIESPEIKGLLNTDFTFGNFFKDREKMMKFLVDDKKILSRQLAEELFRAKVNISYFMSKEAILNPVTVMCNTTLLRRFLEVENSSTIDVLSNTMCNLNSSTVEQLIELIQAEFDFGKVIQMLSNYVAFLGELKLSTALNDLAKLVEMSANFTSFAGIPQKTLQFLTNWMSTMLKDLADILEGNPVIREVQALTFAFSKIEPLVTFIVGKNDSTWNAIMGGLSSISSLITTANQTIDIIMNGKLTFGNLVANSKTIPEFIQSLGVEISSAWKILMKSKLNNEKVIMFLTQMITGTPMKTLICHNPGLINLVYLSPGSPEKTKVEQMQAKLCQLDEAKLVIEMTQIFNVTQVMEVVNDFGKKQASVEWSKLISSISNIPKGAEALSLQLSGIMTNLSSILHHTITTPPNSWKPEDIINLGITMSSVLQLFSNAITSPQSVLISQVTLKFLNKKMQHMMTYKSSALETFLPHTAIKNLTEHFFDAMPELLPILLSSSVPVSDLALNMGKKEFCVNMTMLDFLPMKSRHISSILTLSNYLCTFVHQLPEISAVLEKEYKPLIDAFMNPNVTMNGTVMATAITEILTESTKFSALLSVWNSSYTWYPFTKVISQQEQLLGKLSHLGEIFMANPLNNSIIRTMTQYFDEMDKMFYSNPMWMSARNQMLMQLAVMKILRQKLLLLRNGVDIQQAFLPNAQIQSLMSTMFHAMPDIMEAQAALLNDGKALKNLQDTIMGGGMLCLNYSLVDMFPSKYKTRSSLVQFSQSLCQLIYQLHQIERDLSNDYGPLIQLFTNFSAPKVVNWEESIMELLTINTEIESLIRQLNTEKLLGPASILLNGTVLTNAMMKIGDQLGLFLNTTIWDPNFIIGQLPNIEIFFGTDENSKMIMAVMKDQLVRQIHWQKFMNNLAMELQSGNSITKFLLPNNATQSLLQETIQGIPDLLGAFITQMSDLQGPMKISQTLASGMLCSNFTLLDLIPTKYRTKESMMSLSSKVCEMMANMPMVASDLIKFYQPLIDTYTEATMTTNSTINELLQQLILYQVQTQTALQTLSANLTVLSPFDKLLDSAFLSKLLSVMTSINASNVSNNILSIEAIQSYLYSVSMLEMLVANETWWKDVKNNLAMQNDIMRTVYEILGRIKNGSGVIEAALPNKHIQDFIIAATNAVPDLIEAQGMVMRDDKLLQHQMSFMLGGGIPCVNYTIPDLYPMPYKNRSSITSMNSMLCQMMGSLPSVTQDLEATYKAFIQIFAGSTEIGSTKHSLKSMLDDYFKYYSMIMNIAAINNTMALLKPFQSLMLPSVQQRLMAVASAYIPPANISLVNLMNQIQNIFLPPIYALDSVLQKNPVWESMVGPIKMQLDMQAKVMKFQAEMLEKIKNGSNLVSTLLPNAEVQNLTTAMLNAIPDILQAQMVLLKNSSTIDAFTSKLLKGELICDQVFILELFPIEFREKLTLQNLNTQFCSLMSKVNHVTGDLMNVYQPLISLLTMNASETRPLAQSIPELNYYLLKTTEIAGAFDESILQTAFLSIVSPTFVISFNSTVQSILPQLLKMFASNDTLANVKSSLDVLGQILTSVESGLTNDTYIASIRSSFQLQVNVLKFINEKLAIIMNGTNAVQTLLPNAEVYAFLNAFVMAAPDLMAVQASMTANASAVVGFSRVISKGGIPCLNYTLLELFPVSYRSLPSLKNLQTALCNMMQNMGKIVGDLMTAYQPLIKEFESYMNGTQTTTASWSVLISQYMSYQQSLQMYFTSVSTDKLPSIIAPFHMFMGSAITEKIMTEWRKIEQSFIMSLINGSSDSTNDATTNTLTQIYSIMDVIMKDNAAWDGVKQNIVMQSSFLQFLNTKLENVKAGKTVFGQLIPQGDLQNLTEALVAALPDLFEIQTFLLNNTLYIANIVQRLSSGGIPCVNYTINSLFPDKYQSRPNLQLLEKEICSVLITNQEKVLQELMMSYMKVIMIFTSNETGTGASMSWHDILSQYSLFSSNVMAILNVSSNVMIWRPFINVMANTALLSQVSNMGSAMIDPVQVSSGGLVSAFTLLDSQLSMAPQWHIFKAYLNATGEILAIANSRVSNWLATGHIEKAITETVQLQELVVATVDAIPFIVQDLTPSRLSQIAQNIISLTKGTICLNFTVVDVLGLTTPNQKVIDFNRAMCQLLPALPEIQNEYLKMIMVFMSAQNATEATVNILDIMSSSMTLQMSLQTVLSNITRYLMPFTSLTSPTTLQQLGKLASFVNSSSDPTELAQSLQTIINILQSSSTDKNVDIALALINDLQKMILDSWKKFKDGNYDFTLLFNNSDVNRIFHLIDKYPIILQTIMATSADIMKNPGKAILFNEKYSDICNPTNFDQLITVPAGTNHTVVRNIICNLLGINGTRLLNQLMSVIPGTITIMHKIVMIQQNQTIPKTTLDVMAIFRNYNALFAEVAGAVAQIKPGFDPALFNSTVLMALLGPSLENFQATITFHNNLTSALKNYETQLLPIILLLQGSNAVTKTLLNQTLTAMKAAMNLIVGGYTNLEKEMSGTADGQMLWSLINNLPHVVSIITKMEQIRPNSLQPLINEITKLASNSSGLPQDTLKYMCANINLTTLLDVRLIENSNKLFEFWNTLCAVDVMKGLPPSIISFIQIFMPNSANYTLSKTEVSDILKIVSSGLSKIVSAAGGEVNSVTSWAKFLPLFQVNFTTSSTPFDYLVAVKQLDEMIPLLNMTDIGRSFLQSMKVITMIMDVVTSELNALNKKNITLEIILRNTTSLKQMLRTVHGIDIKTILNTPMNFSKVIEWAQSGKFGEKLCKDGISALFLTPLLNATVLTSAICSAANPEFMKEIQNVFNINNIIKEASGAFNGMFSFVDLFSKIMQLQALLGGNATSFGSFFDDLQKLATKMSDVNPMELITKLSTDNELWSAMLTLTAQLTSSNDTNLEMAMSLLLYQTNLIRAMLLNGTASLSPERIMFFLMKAVEQSLPLISSSTANSMIVQEAVKQITNMNEQLPGLSTVSPAAVVSLVTNMMGSLLNVSQHLDPMAGDMMKKILLYTFSMLEDVVSANGSVKLAPLVPLQMMEDMMKPSFATEMDLFMKHPNKYISLMSHHNMSEVFCNHRQFQTFFNPTDIQGTSTDILCSASLHNNFAMPKLMRQYKLDSLISILGSGMNSSLEKKMSESMMKVVAGLSNFDMSKLNTMLNLPSSLLNMFMPSATNDSSGALDLSVIQAACPMMMSMMEYMFPKEMNSTSFAMLTFVGDVAADLMPMMKDVPDMICEISALNFSGVMIRGAKYLDVVKFVRMIQDSSNASICDGMVKALTTMNTHIAETQKVMAENWPRIETCLKSMPESVTNISKGLQEVSNLLKDMSLISSLPQDVMTLVQALLGIENVNNGTKTDRKAIMSLTRFLQGASNSSSIIEMLLNTTKKSFEAIAGVTLSIKLEELTNLSTEAFRKTVCNGKLFSEYVDSQAPLELPVSSIGAILCNLSNTELDGIHTGLKIAQIASTIQSPPGFSLEAISGLINTSLTIYSDFEKMFDLSNVLKITTLADIPKLLALFEAQIQSTLKQTSFNEVIKQAESLLNLIQSMDNNTFTNLLMNDLRSVLKGANAFNTLQTFLPIKFKIEEFFDDPNTIKVFIINETKLDPAIVDKIMQSTLSSSEIIALANAIDLSGILCNTTRLGQVLELNKTTSTNSTLQELSLTLCNLNKSINIEHLIETLIKNASIAQYFQSTVDKKIASIIKADNGSLNDLMATMSDIGDLVASTSSISTFVPVVISDPSTSNTLTTFSSVLCGKNDTSSGNGSSTVTTAAPQRRRRKRSTDSMSSKKFCSDLLDSMSTTLDGKIMVKILKPLLDGHILVTPDTPAIRSLTVKINATFAQFGDLNQLGNSMSDSINTLNASAISALKTAIENPLVKNSLSSALGTGTNLSSSLDALESLSTGSTGNSMDFFSKFLTNITSCISFDRFRFYPSASDPVYMQMVKEEYSRNIFAAINFHNIVDKNATTLPKHVQYTLRLPSFISMDTSLLYRTPFPRQITEFKDLKYMQGFQQLQEMIDKAIISTLTGKNESELPKVSLRQFPNECGQKESFLEMVGHHVIPIMLLMSFVTPFLMAVGDAVTDRELNMEKIMFLMGQKSLVHWMVWFIKAMVDFLILNIIMTLCLHFGKILSIVDASLIFVTLLDFSFALIMFGYFLSVFFNKSSMAMLVAILVYFVSYIPYTFAKSAYVYLPLIFFEISMILPAMPLSFMTHYWTSFQESGVPFDWSNVYENSLKFSPFWCLIIQFIQGVGYFIIGWYFHNVIGGRNRVPQPFYFFLTRRYWGFDGGSRRIHPPLGLTNLYENGLSANEPSNSSYNQPTVSVSLRNVTKRYGSKKVVDDLSLDLRRDEVTVLLGPNGAGKSTTMSMLNGLITPTSGTITIEGLDRQNQYNTLKSVVGICTQHESFIPNMTVEANLNYFATMKGLSSKKERKMQVERLIERLGLRHFEKTKASNLSGGKQRCLSIAIAFVGTSSVIILDEPTSGVDPCARRMIWDMISANKIDRTILLCTHHMDEAEIVGDQIVILRQGKLVAHDTPSALREKFGCQYLVSLNFEDEIDALTKENVIQTSKKFIQSVNVETCNEQETNLSIKLTQSTRPSLPSLMKHLEASLDHGILKSIGLTFLALETVFTRVISGSNQEGETNEDINGVPLVLTGLGSKKRSTSGIIKFLSIFYKQSRHLFRNWITYIITFLIPCIIIALTMAATYIIPKVYSYKPLRLTPSIYGANARSFLKMPVNKTTRDAYMMDSIFQSPGIGTLCLSDATTSDFTFTRHCHMNISVVTPTVSPTEASLYQNATPCSCNAATGQLSCPSEYSKGWPTIAYETMPSDTIIILNDHQSSINDFLVAEGRNKTAKEHQLWGGWEFTSANSINVWYNSKGYHTSPSYYNALSNMMLREAIRTKTNNFTKSTEYGITTFSHPFVDSKIGLTDGNTLAKMIDISIAVVIMVAATILPASLMLRVMRERLSREKFMQQLYGIHPFMYWTANFIWDLLMSMFVLGIFALLFFAFKVPSFYEKQNLGAVLLLLFLHCFALLPKSYFLSRLFDHQGKAFLVLFILQIITSFAVSLFLLVLSLSSNGKLSNEIRIMEFIFMIFPSYATSLGLTRLAENQVFASIVEPLGIFVYKSPFSFEMLGYNYIYLAVCGVLFFILNLLVETQTCKRAFSRINCKPSCCKKRGRSIKYTSREGDISFEDQTVYNEKERIQANKNSLSLAICNLSKSYSSAKVKAVSEVSFGVERGQCFGLLGKNGAGKTSLFKCITGEIFVSHGSARIFGRNYGTAIHDLGGRVGYCPQNDPLDHLLTVFETLTFYGRLAGMRDPVRTQRNNELMHALDIYKYRNIKVKNLSGGNRRKLSVAVALVGDPEVLLLDEPSSGVDVVSKKLIWRLLSSVQPHTAILLTSHSMEEMQIVSSRLAVMVNGKLRAVGTCPELKLNFGSTYTIQVWSTPISINTIQHQLILNLPGCQLKCQKANVSEFTVPVHSVSLSHVLESLETLKQSSIGIREYAIQHTTLEQVFLQLSDAQSDGMCGSDISSSYEYGTYRSSSQQESTDNSGVYLNKGYVNEDDEFEKL